MSESLGHRARDLRVSGGVAFDDGLLAHSHAFDIVLVNGNGHLQIVGVLDDRQRRVGRTAARGRANRRVQRSDGAGRTCGDGAVRDLLLQLLVDCKAANAARYCLEPFTRVSSISAVTSSEPESSVLHSRTEQRSRLSWITGEAAVSYSVSYLVTSP